MILQTFVRATRARILQPPAAFSGPTLLAGGVVLAVAVASFMRGPLLPEIGRDLRISAADLAFITTAFALGRLVMDLVKSQLMPSAIAWWSFSKIAVRSSASASKT